MRSSPARRITPAYATLRSTRWVGKIIAAKDRASLIVAAHALDRILLWNWYFVPQWHLQEIWVAHWKPVRPHDRAGAHRHRFLVLVGRPDARRQHGCSARPLMGAYLLRRLVLVIPTLFGIITINFAVVQFAPGGPVEQMLAELRGQTQTLSRITGGGSDVAQPSAASGMYRGRRGLDPQTVAQIQHMFGFDKPPLTRYLEMVGAYLRFDFGRSFFRDDTVLHLVLERLPVSISIGLWSTLLIYLVSIPLGIAKAVRDGSRFDVASSAVVLVGYAIPGFLFAILLVVLFAGGSFVAWFPLRGLASEGSGGWPWPQRLGDYAWHMVLPTVALVAGGFASLTILTKNCFLDEIGKQYVLTARAKGGRGAAGCCTATCSATPCC